MQIKKLRDNKDRLSKFIRNTYSTDILYEQHDKKIKLPNQITVFEIDFIFCSPKIAKYIIRPGMISFTETGLTDERGHFVNINRT